ncbi:hypothetical protein [Amycolatopsis sp. NPDC049159]|uniref:hypothetical protein n=1 Tax=Amycolatopsis sp. NPDC049159 TaxID=3157210 RepID=UPI0033EDDBE9
MSAPVLARPDELAEMLADWRIRVGRDPYHGTLLPAVERGLLPVARLRVDHMPTVPVLRVVEPRFPRLAAAVRWATTVGAIGVAVGCLGAAAVLTAGMRAGVLR